MADDRNESQQSGGEQGTQDPSSEKQQNPLDEQESQGNEQKRRAPGRGKNIRAIQRSDAPPVRNRKKVTRTEKSLKPSPALTPSSP